MSDTFLPKFASAATRSISGSSASAALDPGCPQVRLYNADTAVCFVKWGVGAQTATTSHMAIAPGATETFTKQDADTLAVIGTAGNLYIVCGHGS